MVDYGSVIILEVTRFGILRMENWSIGWKQDNKDCCESGSKVFLITESFQRTVEQKNRNQVFYNYYSSHFFCCFLRVWFCLFVFLIFIFYISGFKTIINLKFTWN